MFMPLTPDEDETSADLWQPPTIGHDHYIVLYPGRYNEMVSGAVIMVGFTCDKSKRHQDQVISHQT